MQQPQISTHPTLESEREMNIGKGLMEASSHKFHSEAQSPRKRAHIFVLARLQPYGLFGGDESIIRELPLNAGF